MQSDRRLVQHVHHAGQSRADLRRESNPLRFTARQCFRGAVEREVIEADVIQKREPRNDFLDDPIGDRRLVTVELQTSEEFGCLLQRPRRYLVDRARIVAVADLDVPRFAPEPRATAFGARLVVQVFGELLAHHHRIGLAVATLEIGNDALERMLLHERLAAFRYVRERNLLVA